MDADRTISQNNLIRLERLFDIVERVPVNGEAVLVGLLELELDEQTDHGKLNQEVERVFNKWLMDTLVLGI